MDRPVTALLRRWGAGDRDALEELLPVVYGELRRIAAGQMRRERAGHTLRTTAVVHEAYLRLVDADLPARDRGHFFALAARTMRRVLVDHARGRDRDKRGGGERPLPLDEVTLAEPAPNAELLDLDRALERLRELDERQATMVDLHFFAGLGNDEIAELLEVSRSTVQRDLRSARAFLKSEMS